MIEDNKMIDRILRDAIARKKKDSVFLPTVLIKGEKGKEIEIDIEVEYTSDRRIPYLNIGVMIEEHKIVPVEMSITCDYLMTKVPGHLADAVLREKAFKENTEEKENVMTYFRWNLKSQKKRMVFLSYYPEKNYSVDKTAVEAKSYFFDFDDFSPLVEVVKGFLDPEKAKKKMEGAEFSYNYS